MTGEDMSLAQAVGAALGGTVAETAPGREELAGYEVLSGSASVHVLVNFNAGVDIGFVWGGGAASVRREAAGGRLSEFRRAGVEGLGRLDVRVRFRLAGAPGLGWFEVRSSSWEFGEQLEALVGSSEPLVAEVRCALRLELVRFRTCSGAGTSYRGPRIEVLVGGGGARAEGLVLAA
ncbi:hypothetical protein [Streptomyces sp. NBC_00448]|uniref:hypothetical protein n=1 Tax=Streptomyces sp. NBC_00448 TaxID=2903652 RepID=UPI002E1AFA38